MQISYLSILCTYCLYPLCARHGSVPGMVLCRGEENSPNLQEAFILVEETTVDRQTTRMTAVNGVCEGTGWDKRVRRPLCR